MPGACANPSCLVSRQQYDGTLFRVDIELGDKSGGLQRKTAYVWLCSRCAALMTPKVEVTKTAVRVRLTRGAGSPSALVN